jgi:hypothetical protein
MADSDNPRARRRLALVLAGTAGVDPRTAEKWLRGVLDSKAHSEMLERAARRLKLTQRVAELRGSPA